jgi:hypothetical protein
MDKIYAFKQMGCQGSIEETFTAIIMAIEDHFSSSLRAELSYPVHVLVEQEQYELNAESTHDDSNKFKMTKLLKSFDMKYVIDVSKPYEVKKYVDIYRARVTTQSWNDPASFPEWTGFILTQSKNGSHGLSSADRPGTSTCLVGEKNVAAATAGRPKRSTANVIDRYDRQGEEGDRGDRAPVLAKKRSTCVAQTVASAEEEQIRVSFSHFTGRRCSVALRRVGAAPGSEVSYPTEDFVGVVYVAKSSEGPGAVGAATVVQTTTFVVTLKTEYISEKHVRFTVKTLGPSEAYNQKISAKVEGQNVELLQVHRTKSFWVSLRDDSYVAVYEGASCLVNLRTLSCHHVIQ